MKIRYVHSSNPKKECELDTRVQQRADEIFTGVFGLAASRTEEEYDKYLLEKMELDKKAGKIIRYEVVKPKISVLKYGESFDEGKRYGDDLRYFSNCCGDLHHWGQYDITEDELPEELKKLYHTLWAEDEYGLYCYLVEFKGQYGIALIAEYHEYEADGSVSDYGYNFAEKVSETLSERLPEIAPGLHAQIVLAKEQGFPGSLEEDDPATELVLFMDHDVSEENYRAAGKLFGSIAFEELTPTEA